MSDERDIYNFEGIVETAVKELLVDNDLKAFASGEVWNLQTDRPRVEVYFIRGAGQGRWAARASLPEHLQSEKIESAWKCALHFSIVVNPDAAGKLMLAAYRSRIRTLIPNLAKLLNGEYLEQHALRMPRDTGDAREMEPQNGFERLLITTEFDFSIQATAWALLPVPE